MAEQTPATGHATDLLRHLDDAARRNGYAFHTAYLEHLTTTGEFPHFKTFYMNVLKRFQELGGSHQRIEEWSRKSWLSLFRKLEREYTRRSTSVREKHTKRSLRTLINTRLDEIGQNQKWLAEKLNISKQSVHQYVHGRAYPRKPLLVRLVKLLSL